MSWWRLALYDTCSIITLDKLLQIRPGLSRKFPKKILGLAESFSTDQMVEETKERMMERIEFCNLPPTTDLAHLLSSSALSKALSDVDKLVFATSVHFQFDVVTGDKRLARAIQKQGLEVGNMALILKELVETKKLKSAAIEKILQQLADRKDYLLGKPDPTWNDLKEYTFPD